LLILYYYINLYIHLLNININKLLKAFFLLFLFTIPFYGLNAQTISVQDEVTKTYQSATDLYKQKNYEDALVLVLDGLERAKEINDENLIAYGYFHQAKYYERKGPYLESVALLKKALIIFEKLNNNSQIARCYYRLGVSYFKNSKYDLALDYYLQSLKLDQESAYKPGIALNLERIGKLYLNTGDFFKARTSFESALIIFKELKDRRVLMNEFCIAVTYQKEAMKYQKDNLFYKAIELYEILLLKCSKTSVITTGNVLQNIGSSYRFLKNYEKSLEYLLRSLPLTINQGFNKDIAHTCNDIAETYLDMNNLSKAREYALKAIDVAKVNNLRQERYAYYILHLVEEKARNYKGSLDNYKKYQKIQDSIFSMEKTTKINDLRIKYESEKQGLKIKTQESNIALLDSNNSIKNLWILFGGLGLIAIFLLFTAFKSKNNVTKEKKQQEIFSQDLIQSQEDERTRIARELHDSLGQKLTLIKKKSQNLDQFEITSLTNNALEEVRSISRGLYPALLQELGLSQSIAQLINEYDKQTPLFFTVDLDNIDENFTESTSLNFYRLIQECLTNIVKHAKAKAVTVSVKEEKNTIIAFISDNGQGFDVADSKNKNSLGLKTIFERIRIMEGKLSIDSKLNTGTNFIFTIPIKNES